MAEAPDRTLVLSEARLQAAQGRANRLFRSKLIERPFECRGHFGQSQLDDRPGLH